MIHRNYDPRRRIHSWSVILLTTLALGSDLAAQELITDRPDQTESAVTVPEGSWQIETGWTFTHDEEGAVTQETHEAPGTLLRIGLSARWELRVGWAGIAQAKSSTPVGAVKQEGIQDGDIGAKVRLWEERDRRPEAALLFGVSTPIGDSDFSSDRFDPSFRLSFSHTLTENLSLGYNLGAAWSTNRDGLGNSETKSHLIYTLVLGRSISDRLGAFVESFGSLGGSAAGPPEHSLDGGLTLLISRLTQLDLAAGVGISSAAPDWFIGAGISLRYPY